MDIYVHVHVLHGEFNVNAFQTTAWTPERNWSVYGAIKSTTRSLGQPDWQQAISTMATVGAVGAMGAVGLMLPCWPPAARGCKKRR